MIAFLRNLVIQDFWLKLLSLVFAVFIWLSVSKVFLKRDVSSPLAAFGTHVVEHTYVNIPILVTFPAAEVRDVVVEPTEVRVTVSGEPKVIDSLRWQDIQARVDLTGIQSASALRKSIEIIVPSGVKYTRVVPDEVDVTVPER